MQSMLILILKDIQTILGNPSTFHEKKFTNEFLIKVLQKLVRCKVVCFYDIAVIRCNLTLISCSSILSDPIV